MKIPINISEWFYIPADTFKYLKLQKYQQNIAQSDRFWKKVRNMIRIKVDSMTCKINLAVKKAQNENDEIFLPG